MPKADKLPLKIKKIAEQAATANHIIIISQDWHPEGHVSFASSHPKKISPFESIRVHVPDEVSQQTRSEAFPHDAPGGEMDQGISLTSSGSSIEYLKELPASKMEESSVSKPKFSASKTSLTSENLMPPPNIYLGVYPEHCIAGSHGAELVPELSDLPAHMLIKKGQDKSMDFLSLFEDASGRDTSGLGKLLHDNGVRVFVIVGVATEVCIQATALDSIAHGFRTIVLTDAIAAVDEFAGEHALKSISSAGGELLTWEEYSNEIMADTCNEK